MRVFAAGASVTLALATASAHTANVFRFAFQGDIKSLDPYLLKESFTIGMHTAVYESLITRDKDLKLARQLAESWETPEPTRWRFHLRRGVKFHDGSDFTADDVIFSATPVRAAGSNFQTNVPSDAQFVKVDDVTVDMVLKKPNPIAVYQFNPKIDAITDQVEGETDQAKRNAAIKQGFEILQADWGAIPLHQQALAWGVSRKVTLTQRPDNELLLFWVSKQP